MATTFGVTGIAATDLVEKIVAQLQLKLKAAVPADCVFETLADDEHHVEFPPADRFVTVAPERFARSQPLFAGAGRYAPAFDGTFRVACLCRFASDQEGRSTRELRDKTRSTLALALLVVDALDGFTMATAGASPLLQPVAAVAFDVRPKRVKRGGPWAVIACQFAVKFVLALPGGTADP